MKPEEHPDDRRTCRECVHHDPERRSTVYPLAPLYACDYHDPHNAYYSCEKWQENREGRLW